MARVSEEEFDKLIKEKDKLIIADFYSDSCIPCKRISPILAEVDAEYDDVIVAKINVNFEKNLTKQYNIMSSPTLVYKLNRQELHRTVGIVKKADIVDIITNLKGE